MKKLFTKLLDCFFLSRPMLWIPVWGFSIFGYLRGIHQYQPSFQSLPSSITDKPTIFLWMIVFSCAVGAVYILNQWADIEVDKKNSGLPLLARGIVTKRDALISTIVLSLIALIVPLRTHPVLSILGSASIILGLLYSFKPTYFSGRPFGDFIANAIGYGFIAFGAGWHLSGSPLMIGLFASAALPYFFLMCAGSISSTLPDYDADKACGKNTTAVFLGIQKAHLLAMIFLIVSLIVSIINNDFICGISAGVALPFYYAYLIKKSVTTMEAMYKVGGGISMIFAAIFFWIFIPAGVLMLAVTWLYFRIRHGVAYPSLKPININ